MTCFSWFPFYFLNSTPLYIFIIKELSNKKWLILHKKSKFLGISLNNSYKKEIIELIETQMPYTKGIIL